MAKANRVLLITPAFFKANTVVDENATDKIIQTCIRKAEDKYIMALVGSPLYESINAKITGNTLTGNYKILMDEYIVPALLDYALYEYIPFTFKFKNKGVLKQGSPDSSPADTTDLSYLRQNVLDSAEFYSEMLINYLKANSANFPEYYSSNSIDDIPPANNAYFSGIVYPKKGSNPDGKGFTYDINF